MIDLEKLKAQLRNSYWCHSGDQDLVEFVTQTVPLLLEENERLMEALRGLLESTDAMQRAPATFFVECVQGFLLGADRKARAALEGKP